MSWIPTSEQKPPADTWFLFTLAESIRSNTNPVQYGWHDVECMLIRRHDAFGFEYAKVSHWMLLPAPPTSEKP